MKGVEQTRSESPDSAVQNQQSESFRPLPPPQDPILNGPFDIMRASSLACNDQAPHPQPVSHSQPVRSPPSYPAPLETIRQRTGISRFTSSRHPRTMKNGPSRLRRCPLKYTMNSWRSARDQPATLTSVHAHPGYPAVAKNGNTER